MSIGRSKFPHAQEVSETFSTKLIAIKYLILSVLLNIVLLLLAVFMGQGLEVPFSPRFANITFGVAVEAVILITNILTLKTLDLGVAIFISMLMTNRSGYGLVSCGFIQAKPLERLQYAQSLSLNSTCRKTLERVAYLWILLELLKALSPFAATDVFNMPIRTLSGSVNCIVFDANPSKTTDRTYPTLESSSGTAEFLFGRALGCMRSERGDCGEGSLFAFGPQLDGAVNDGDAVAGEGFAMKIATHCQCMDISLPEAVTQGYLTMKDQAIVLDWVQKGLPYPFLVLMQNMNITGNSFLSTTVLGGAQTCGGYSMFVLPVCTTNISSFENAMIVSSYATDGTTASIALVASDIYGNSTNSRSAITSQDIRNALAAILPPSAPYELVPNIPGLGNALMWWMSTDLRAFDPTLLPQGMETMYAVILRAGIQRTFNTFGSSCLREVFRNDATTVSFNTRGTLTVYVIGGLQLLISAFSFLLASVWFFSPSPLGPAIRIVTQPMYFISLLCESPFWFNLQGTGNAQSHVMWQQLDTIARIGESLDTLDEPIGRLRIDRPRLVKSLANGRIYA
ncbi:hypothetical protein BC830DRAFT_1058694 [Chytriomyces sp. MP71]|nr:hypothetical protein BC830DRAFT_1058694 [Chytriomyces sp. MP71]